MDRKELVETIEILLGFTRNAERLLSELQKNLGTLQKAVQEADKLIDKFTDQLSQTEEEPWDAQNVLGWLS